MTPQEQALFDHAKAALPRWLEATPELAAFAKIVGQALAQAQTWYDYAKIREATGIWLDQHARDRGTARQAGESDASLAARLRSIQDAVTRPALETAIGFILDPVDPVGCEIVNLRMERGFFWVDPARGRKSAYFSRGYRMGRSARPMIYVVILPYGTTAQQVTAVEDLLRQQGPAGYNYVIEVRANP